MEKLFEELKRRKVARVAGIYAVVAWLLIQVTNNIVAADDRFLINSLVGEASTTPITLILNWNPQVVQ